MNEQPSETLPPIAATGPDIGTPAQTRLDRWLSVVPRALSSHVHVLFLFGLGVYLMLPLFHVPVSQLSELIGGNYTNVASAIGGGIAAGGTVTIARQQKRRTKITEQTHQIMADLYRHTTGEEHPAAPDARP